MPTSLQPRELWLTEAVQHFLRKYGQTENARQLCEDIARAVDGRDNTYNVILLTAPTFLLCIKEPEYTGGRDRVLVWHGPSDGGAFYKPEIMKKATLCGAAMV